MLKFNTWKQGLMTPVGLVVLVEILLFLEDCRKLFTSPFYYFRVISVVKGSATYKACLRC